MFYVQEVNDRWNIDTGIYQHTVWRQSDIWHLRFKLETIEPVK